jgi:lysylphosphatidylglycerol synthetase-like protein (DUF2156 family)
MELFVIEDPTNTMNAERRCVVEKIRRLGSAASNAVLDPSCNVFSLPEIEGIICYRIEASCAIIYGNPVCRPEDRQKLVQAFHHDCQTKTLNIIYIGVNENFANWAIDNVCKALVEFGEELVMDPHMDPKARTGVNASLVRRKVRHAQKEGTEILEYLSYDQKIEEALEKVGQSWLENRQGPQVHISNIRLFSDRIGKRWFYAKKGDKIVGVMMLNKLEAHQGWLLNHLMFTPEAANGTPEFLLTTALETLANEGCHFVTFGSVPAPQLGEIKGLNKFTEFMSRILYKVTRKIFHLDGRKKFWEKFHPESERSFLLFSQPRIGRKELIALMRAMNVGMPKK